MNAKVIIKNDAKPSAQATEQAIAEITVKDSRGRIITLKKPNVLAQFRLVKMLGESARNSAYMAMVTPLTYLVSFDGDAIIPPQTERELDALIQRLDEPGIMAILDALAEHFGSDETEEDEEEALKNS